MRPNATELVTQRLREQKHQVGSGLRNLFQCVCITPITHAHKLIWLMWKPDVYTADHYLMVCRTILTLKMAPGYLAKNVKLSLTCHWHNLMLPIVWFSSLKTLVHITRLQLWCCAWLGGVVLMPPHISRVPGLILSLGLLSVSHAPSTDGVEFLPKHEKKHGGYVKLPLDVKMCVHVTPRWTEPIPTGIRLGSGACFRLDG